MNAPERHTFALTASAVRIAARCVWAGVDFAEGAEAWDDLGYETIPREVES